MNSPCAMWEEEENMTCHVGYNCKILVPPCITQVNQKSSLNKEISNSSPLVTAVQSCTCEKQPGYKIMPSFLKIHHGDFQSGVHGEDLTMIYFSLKGIRNSLAPQ